VCGAGWDDQPAPEGDATMSGATDLKKFLLAFIFTIAGFSLLFFVLTTMAM